MREDEVRGPETIACPRCLWARMAQGADACLRLRVGLRAHLAVCHPGVPEARASAVADGLAARPAPPPRRPPSLPTALPAAIG
ncbi:MAG: hypothetical protein KIT14_14695 [bacterium]|nr:hypothetical protein [bacterium]